MRRNQKLIEASMPQHAMEHAMACKNEKQAVLTMSWHGIEHVIACGKIAKHGIQAELGMLRHTQLMPWHVNTKKGYAGA